MIVWIECAKCDTRVEMEVPDGLNDEEIAWLFKSQKKANMRPSRCAKHNEYMNQTGNNDL